MDDLAIFPTLTGQYLAKRICDSIKRRFNEEVKISPSIRKKFEDGTIITKIDESVRKKDCYVIGCMDDSVYKNPPEELIREDIFPELSPPSKKFQLTRNYNDNFMELLSYINALSSSEAMSVTAVVPTYPFARQERTRGREPKLAKMAAEAMESAGANRIISVDVHSPIIEGFFSRFVKFQNLYSSSTIIDYLKTKYADVFKDFSVVAPDFGGIERARWYADKFGVELIKSDKIKDYESKEKKIDHIEITKNPKKVSFTVDDMIDTAGTITELADVIKKSGGEDFYVATTHPLFNRTAIKKISDAYREGRIKKVFGTNTVNHFYDTEIFEKEGSTLGGLEWFELIPIEDLLAQCIFNVHNRMSVSQLLK